VRDPRPSPPRLARALLRLLPAGQDQAFLAADLDEEFQDIAVTAGLVSARRWYWKQVWLSAAPLLGRRGAILASSLRAPAATGQPQLRTSLLQNLTTDLRYAWRMSRRAPIVTCSVIFAIALGIAASTAIFSVMEGVFLRPLPFHRPEQLVRFSTAVAKFGRVREVNYLDARDWQAGSSRLEAIGRP
jgi:hypothetical protein